MSEGKRSGGGSSSAGVETPPRTDQQEEVDRASPPGTPTMPPLHPGSSITISMLPTGGLAVTAGPGVVTPGASAASTLSAPLQLGGPASGPPSIWAIL